MPYFNSGARAGASAAQPGPEPGSPNQRPAPGKAYAEDEWRSQADDGWEAAQTAAEPTAGGLTSSGLPKRVPKANLVPGAAPQQDNTQQTAGRSAERVRNRFSGFQQGLRQGRGQTGAQEPEER